MQVDFYQLTRDPAEAVLPAIAANVLKGGGRLLVVSGDPAQLERISRGLWDAGPDTYLAHDRAEAPMPEVQPILLGASCDDATNGARMVALADGQWRDEALDFDRAFYLFDDATIEGARASWRTLSKADGVKPRFWKQDGGKWRQGP
jgi:DNA polymerase III subunit chi